MKTADEHVDPSPATFAELLWRHKWWWLAPILAVGALTIGVLWAGQGLGNGPFVYTLF